MKCIFIVTISSQDNFYKFSMSLRKSDTVDFIVYFEKKSLYVLALVIDEDLSKISDLDFGRLMSEKLQNYAEYILEGKMLTEYPNMQQGKVEIGIKVGDPLTKVKKQNLKAMAKKLASYGIPLRYSRIGGSRQILL